MALNEVVVKATKVKMYYKGDTLVYDADAFKLPDGSMLDALIRQLPGVTMNDGGEIFVNGRRVDDCARFADFLPWKQESVDGKPTLLYGEKS